MTTVLACSRSPTYFEPGVVPGSPTIGPSYLQWRGPGGAHWKMTQVHDTIGAETPQQWLRCLGTVRHVRTTSLAGPESSRRAIQP